jgi:phosphatidylserine/phosphatidylglycerophosphate/cardiolipin synthase-like enzyme
MGSGRRSGVQWRLNAKVRVFMGGGYPEILVPILNAAEHTIDVCQYEWIWYRHSSRRRVHKISLAVQAAAKRGVKIRAILNRESDGHYLTKKNAQTANELRRAGVQVKFGMTGVADHAKFWIVDNKLLIVTSHNLSTRSCTANSELGVVVEGELAARDAKAYFEKLWGRT